MNFAETSYILEFNLKKELKKLVTLFLGQNSVIKFVKYFGFSSLVIFLLFAKILKKKLNLF